MTDPTPLPSRRFNEKEVALIIKHASELQESEAPVESAAGMSLAELEQVAREAGLDPALVKRAAATLDTRVSEKRPSLFLGAPTALQLERTIEGEIPEEEYEVIVLEIQRVLGEMGGASTLGRTLQWTSTPVGARRTSTRTVQVTITPRHGRTTIRIEEPLGSLAGGLFAGIMGGMGMGLMPLAGVAGGALGATGGGPAVQIAAAATGCLAFLGGTYMLARTIFTRVASRRGRTLQTLMERLVEHVAAMAKRASGSDSGV